MQHAQLTLLLQLHCTIKHMIPVKHFTASDDSTVPDSGQQQAASNSFATALQQLCNIQQLLLLLHSWLQSWHSQPLPAAHAEKYPMQQQQQQHWYLQ
jgi:hypothetical protein